MYADNIITFGQIMSGFKLTKMDDQHYYLADTDLEVKLNLLTHRISILYTDNNDIASVSLISLDDEWVYKLITQLKGILHFY